MTNLLNRYEVTLTDTTDPSNKIHSFTWESTPEAAAQRMTEQMAERPEVWGGWTFELKH